MKQYKVPGHPGALLHSAQRVRSGPGHPVYADSDRQLHPAPCWPKRATIFSGLLHAITRVACFYGVGILAVFIQNRTMAKITQGTLKRLRDDLFVHMQTLPIKYLTATPTATSCRSTPTISIPCASSSARACPSWSIRSSRVVSVFLSMIYLNVPLTRTDAGHGRRYDAWPRSISPETPASTSSSSSKSWAKSTATLRK